MPLAKSYLKNPQSTLSAPLKKLNIKQTCVNRSVNDEFRKTYPALRTCVTHPEAYFR